MKPSADMKIILVRHGKPKAATNPRVNAIGFANWVRRYNRSCVSQDDAPPVTLCDKIAGFYSLSSDLRRAIHSTELCLAKQPDLVLKELREMEIPRLKLPFSMNVNYWLIIARLLWFLCFSGNSESLKEARQRIENLANILESKVLNEKQLVVFGHGLLNQFLAKELLKRGWEINSQGRGYWSSLELSNTKYNEQY